MFSWPDGGSAGWSPPSGRRWQGSQSSEGATELVFPGPAPWQMQSEPSGHREEASSQGLGGHHLLAQTDERRPACQVVGEHLDGQPGSVGGEAARGEMVQPDAVLEVSDGVLDLGVAPMVGLQFQGFPVPVGDEAVIAVGGKEGQLGTGRGFYPPDDEPRGCGVRLTLEGGAGRGCRWSRPQRRRRPSSRESASSPPRVWPRSGSAGGRAGGW